MAKLRTWNNGDRFQGAQHSKRSQRRQVAQVDSHRHIPNTRHTLSNQHWCLQIVFKSSFNSFLVNPLPPLPLPSHLFLDLIKLNLLRIYKPVWITPSSQRFWFLISTRSGSICLWAPVLQQFPLFLALVRFILFSCLFIWFDLIFCFCFFLICWDLIVIQTANQRWCLTFTTSAPASPPPTPSPTTPSPVLPQWGSPMIEFNYTRSIRLEW